MMDTDALAEVRATLEEERAQHMQLLDEHGADVHSDEIRSLDVGNDGFADSGQATEERAELLAHIVTARDRVRDIDAALARMDEGNYGICITCGEEIPAGRLEIRPLSVQCVNCASKGA
jgi:DnaK suppressor protein